MVNIRRPKLKAIAASVVGSCVIACYLFDVPRPLPPSSFVGRSSRTQFSRRGLLSSARLKHNNDRDRRGRGDDGDDDREDGVFSWAERRVRPLSARPDPLNETALFWHIPKSGGTTAKSIYRCLGEAVDVEARPGQISHSESIGLVPLGHVDVIFSPYPVYAIEHLFDPSHMARVLALFRHPIERLISLFYYLQTANWEASYRPEWKDMNVLEWAESHNADINTMLKRLAGKGHDATEEDLLRATNTIRRHFVVGLVTEMEESFRRFNAVIGVDETKPKHEACMQKYFGGEGTKENSNAHPKLEEGSPAWELLAEKNALDIRLHEFVVELFEEQREVIDSYASDGAVETSGG